MDKIIATAPIRYIPPLNVIPYHFLSLLADGNPHSKEEILIALGDDPRSARQALTGKAYGYWLIHNIGDKKAVYQLDRAHISGDRDLDRKARAIALKRLKDKSKKQSEREKDRLPKAIKEQAKANSIYQECFQFFEKEKPTPE